MGDKNEGMGKRVQGKIQLRVVENWLLMLLLLQALEPLALGTLTCVHAWILLLLQILWSFNYNTNRLLQRQQIGLECQNQLRIFLYFQNHLHLTH